MKQRILSAAVGIALLVGVMFLYQTLVLNVAAAIIAAVSVYEILHAVGLFPKHPGLAAACVLYAAAFPFLALPGLPDLRVAATVALVLVLFCILLRVHQTLHIEKLAFAGCTTVSIAFCISVLVYLRDGFAPYSLYYICLLFFVAWICDAGAYFVGRAFGKHKMSPKISPNKTVEGAIGGVLVNLVMVALLTLVFQLWVYPQAQFHLIPLAILSVAGTFAGMLGDLSASVVKRQVGIKDFGNLIPGHGGMVDRFDSWMFVAFLFYPFVCAFPIVQ